MGPCPVSAVADIGAVIASLTREVADFPTAGVEFKDLTPLFADPRALAAVTDALADVASGADLIAGIDARGFLIGGAVATRLGTGVLAIRKGGKLPPPVRTERYQLEYGAAAQRCARGRRAGDRRHGGCGAQVAGAGWCDGDDGRGGAGADRAGRSRAACAAAGAQLAPDLVRQPLYP